jgi:hypothetical protein
MFSSVQHHQNEKPLNDFKQDLMQKLGAGLSAKATKASDMPNYHKLSGSNFGNNSAKK